MNLEKDFKIETKYNVFTNKFGSFTILKKSSGKEFSVMTKEIEQIFELLQTNRLIEDLEKTKKELLKKTNGLNLINNK